MIKELRINRTLIYELNKQYFAKYNDAIEKDNGYTIKLKRSRAILRELEKEIDKLTVDEMTDRMKEIDKELPGRDKDDVWLYVYKNGKEKYRNDLIVRMSNILVNDLFQEEI